MLQAALHVESDLEQHLSSSGSATALTLNNHIHAKPRNVEQLSSSHDSVPVNKISNARTQCCEDITPVSTTDTMKVAVAPAAAFCLSQDDFDDDIDDLSFTDLPLHTESSHVSLSSTVTSDCRKAAAVVSEKNNLSRVKDVISKHRHVQLQSNNDLKRSGVTNMQLAQNGINSSATVVDFTHRSGKYFMPLVALTSRL